MSNSTQIAIATSSELPELFGGEKLLIPALQALGYTVSVEVWDRAEVDWSRFDIVLVRCTWDYHEKLDRFMKWLEVLQRSRCLVLNDISTLSWNLDKRYLFELAKRGAKIIPGLCLEPSDFRGVSELMRVLGSQELVVKPVQSAGAWRTLRLRGDDAESVVDFNQWRREQVFLVQAFMPEIIEEGEWSLVFFDGKYSHSLLKRAKQGDFRVQSDHGGSVESCKASTALQRQATDILKLLPNMPCYARVDGICRRGEFYLMELELVEPELFLEVDLEAPDRLASAIKNRIDRR